MAFESTTEPIKIGYLMDLILPEGLPETYRQDLFAPFDMVFGICVEGKLTGSTGNNPLSRSGGAPEGYGRQSSMPTRSWWTRAACDSGRISATTLLLLETP